MIVRKILIYPDPFLRRITQEVLSFDDDLAHIIQEMVRTMHSLGHCIGIAANQVGVDRKIFAMDTSRRNKSSQGLVVLINPVVQAHEGRTYSKEGCLSLPPYLGNGRKEDLVVHWTGRHLRPARIGSLKRHALHRSARFTARRPVPAKSPQVPPLKKRG
jgi:peptide deformylase